MPVFIHGETCVDGWRNGARHLLREGPTDNLIVEISGPQRREENWSRLYSPKRLEPSRKSLNDVAATIWPKPLEERCVSRADFYRRYKVIFDRAKSYPRNRRWGTYCQRLIMFGEQEINQVELAITKINSWQNRIKTAFVFHLSSIELDPPRVRGAPCLQYVEILLQQNTTIDLVAIYRSHDYFSLALGNLIGLSDLLEFVCRHTQNEVGKITVHSVYAFNGSTAANLRNLVNSI